MSSIAIQGGVRKPSKRKQRVVVLLVPGARLIGDSVLVHAHVLKALITRYATHRRDPSDRSRLLRVRNARGGTRSVACPALARMLTVLVELLQDGRHRSERQLAEKIDANRHQAHRLLVAAEEDGWLLRSWGGNDEGADEGSRMRGSHLTLCVPAWIDPVALGTIQNAVSLLGPRATGAATAVIRDTSPPSRPDGPHRTRRGEGSATCPEPSARGQVADRHKKQAGSPSTSAAFTAALAVHREQDRFYEHPAYTRVPGRRDPSRRGLRHTDLLVTDLLVRTIVITGSDVVPVKDLAQRSSLSRGSIRSSLRSLNQHGIVVRASRTCWSVPPDLFVRLDDVATRLGLDRVRELRRLDHQAEREDHWERLILHTFMSSADVRRAIKRLGYKVPEHLVSLRSIQEQAEDRGREEAPARAGRVPEPGLVPDRDVLDRETRPTRRYVIRRPPPVEVDLRPCILDLVRLQQRIDGIAENGATSSAITKMITDLIVELAREQGLRVRREVVVPVYREVGRRIRRTWRQRVDLVLTMPGKPPLYVEIDRAEKRESRRKLQWAVSQGHDALWVRWAGLNEVAVVDDGVRVVEPSWRGMRRRVRELTTLLDAS